MEHEKEKIRDEREGVIEMGGGLSESTGRERQREREMERRLLFSNYVAFQCVRDRYQANSTCPLFFFFLKACTRFLYPLSHEAC